MAEIDNLSQQEAALLLGFTARTLRDWPDAPRNTDGSYNAWNLVPWAMKRADGLDLNTERARLAKWQADKAQQDVEHRIGESLWREDVFHWVAGMIETAKARLIQIPEAVGQVVPRDIAELVVTENRRLICEALDELADEREGGIQAAVVALETAPDIDGEPVGGPVPKAVKRKQRRTRAVAD